MKNLIAELLVNLAEKEAQTNDIAARLGALEVVVTALLGGLDAPQRQALVDNVETEVDRYRKNMNANVYTPELLQHHLQRLLSQAS
ncbi:anti-adapter protein IraP [Enterobacteriaceae bacterium BIT-l23]|nr:sigma-S stabilization anti-adapter protein IraP [Jejubacter calystegiae]NUU67081.1 anti-adapter protein IraP [Enterobacteriaceae bacterium BIT-l23]